MKITLRTIMLMMVTLSLALPIGGCGGNQRADNELLVWLVGSEAQAKAINRVAASFGERHGMTVRCEAISWGDAHSKYLTSVAGEIAPDIGMMGLTWGTEFGSLGAMVDLREAYPEDTEKIKRDTFLGLWEAVQYRDHVYGIPFDMSLQLLYYRTDIVRRAPQTWSDLTDLLTKLHKESEQSMILDWGNLSWIGYAPFLWQQGGEFYDSAHQVSALDQPEARAALQFYASLYTHYHVPKTNIPVEQGLRTGDFPLAISGNWKLLGLELGAPEIAGRWSIAPLPAGPSGRRTAFIGGRVMGIFTQSTHQDVAWELIKFLFEPAIQLQLYEEAVASQDSYLPPNIVTWEGLPMKMQFRDVLKQQAMDAKGPPSALGWDDSTRFIDRAIQRVVLEGADPAIELGKAAKEISKRLR